jgi:cytochrome P450
MAIVTEIFHTGAMPQKTRLQYWNRVANTAFGAMHIEPVSSSAQGAGLNDIINSAWKDALICMDPPKHTEMSKLFTDRIGPRHLKDVEQTIHVRAKELAQRLQQNREFDGISDVAYDLSLNVIFDLIGWSEEVRGKLLDYAIGSFDSCGPDAPRMHSPPCRAWRLC